MTNDIDKQKKELIRLATQQQMSAADPEKSVWVEASAGTGKTKVLSDRVLRLLLAKVNNNSNPRIPVEIMHKVELSAAVKILYFFNIVIANIFVVTHNAVGNDFDITFFKKLPFIRSLLGSNAKTNEGMPIVTVLIKLN